MKFKILNSKGVQRHSKQSISFYPTSEHIYINDIRVRNSQGDITYIGKPSDYYLTDSHGNMATHEKVAQIQIKSLAIGSTFEISYTKSWWKYENLMSYKDIWFIGYDPIILRAVSLEGDISDITIQSSTPLQPINDSPTSKFWLKKHISKYHTESYSPSAHKLYTKLSIGSSKQSWKAVSLNYYKHIKDKYQSSADIKSLVVDITKDKETQQEKLKAILQWIQTNITYQAIEFGPRGRMPKPAARTIQTKEGDCKDMSLLLWHMLREIDIEAYIALAHTSENIVTDIAHEDQFNHILVYCPTLPVKVIDPTYNNLNLLQYVPYNLLKNYILPVTSEGSELVYISVPEKPEIEIDIERNISTAKDQFIIRETATVKGFSASYFRNSLAGKSDKEIRQFLNDKFSYSYPNIEIVEAVLKSNAEDNYSPLKIYIHSRQRFRGKHTKIPMLWESNYFLLSRVIDRKTELDNPYKIKINSVNTFDDYSKYNIDNQSFDDKYSSRQTILKNNVLTVRTIGKRCIGSASEYEIFRQQILKLIPIITLKN